ncbi:MAG: nickel pincer cofactor biosynthesis protein LarC [Coriobacteriales bacterium]|jgi:uncharacterized protein (TIGR00299 family) protein|nr:nickel pincer cofactor biosynthesis protein LarC [Coriobacteriales bacterium]
MILHFDFSTGASGDKILGSLLEVSEVCGRADFSELQELMETLVPGIEVKRQRVVRGHIAATQLAVDEEEPTQRNWPQIRAMIQAVAERGILDHGAANLAVQIFESIAQIEAYVHGTSVNQVHFHEVGAADSIFDIVGSAFLFARLAPQAVFATPLVLGFGHILVDHGIMSIPAPATIQLVTGLPVEAGPYEGEMTTPTGAALARSFVTNWQPYPVLRMRTIGYGAGSREITGASNTVRLLAGDVEKSSGLIPRIDLSELDTQKAEFKLETVTLIETNIDHRTPEALAYACEELFNAGALDVWQEPILMKKGRLAVRLALLCPAERSTEFSRLVFEQTGTLGLRVRNVERLVLPRDTLSLDTPWGLVRYKFGRYLDDISENVNNRTDLEADGFAIEEVAGSGAAAQALAAKNAETKAEAVDQRSREANGQQPTGEVHGGLLWLRPEHDDVAHLARKYNMTYQELYEELAKIANKFIFR